MEVLSLRLMSCVTGDTSDWSECWSEESVAEPLLKLLESCVSELSETMIGSSRMGGTFLVCWVWFATNSSKSGLGGILDVSFCACLRCFWERAVGKLLV